MLKLFFKRNKKVSTEFLFYSGLGRTEREKMRASKNSDRGHGGGAQAHLGR
jgi:hypothetical protein